MPISPFHYERGRDARSFDVHRVRKPSSLLFPHSLDRRPSVRSGGRGTREFSFPAAADSKEHDLWMHHHHHRHFSSLPLLNYKERKKESILRYVRRVREDSEFVSEVSEYLVY